MATKTPGQLAYEEDVRRMPLYHDGAPRITWDKLDKVCKYSWDREPIPRDYPDRLNALGTEPT